MRIGFHTFGCKLNQYETESLASSFRDSGHTIVGPADDADVYVLNTCTVTGRADHKARAAVRAMSRRSPGALLIVTGCSAQLEAEALSALGDNVLVVPQSRKGELITVAEGVAAGGDVRAELQALARSSPTSPPDPFAFRAGALSFHTRAFLKIQDGCDGLCAYCRVPSARGGSVCLDPEEAVRRAAGLESQGHREIVLTGVNISSYDSAGVRLPGLVRRMIDSTRAARFRLSSLEPEALTRELAAVLADDRVCPHFHIPVQSGSDRVLSRMRRRYRASRVTEGIALLREAKEDPFIAGDFIAGFPGETDSDHAETLRLAETIRFAALHVFPFSPRPGTAAASLTPRVPERLRDERAGQLLALSRAMSASYARAWTGRVVDVLLESEKGRGAPAKKAGVRGVAANYLKVSVSGAPPKEAVAGRIARVRITAPGETCKAAFIGFA
jgi:threonylcarbamoyladenosine tRNA methylthiotransferase MtaB